MRTGCASSSIQRARRWSRWTASANRSSAACAGLLAITLAGALLVLLVACANVATLFIGRDVARRRELAARMALGATTPQLVRSVLVETSLIAVIASIIGAGLGALMLQVFREPGGVQRVRAAPGDDGTPDRARDRGPDRRRVPDLRRSFRRCTRPGRASAPSSGGPRRRGRRRGARAGRSWSRRLRCPACSSSARASSRERCPR